MIGEMTARQWITASSNMHHYDDCRLIASDHSEATNLPRVDLGVVIQQNITSLSCLHSPLLNLPRSPQKSAHCTIRNSTPLPQTSTHHNQVFQRFEKVSNNGPSALYQSVFIIS